LRVQRKPGAPSDIEAVQYTGNNIAVLQAAGASVQVLALVNGSYRPIPDGWWMVKHGDGNTEVLSEAEFSAKYEAARP
jgi:hypothetical protein